jgi:hypothetical protein
MIPKKSHPLALACLFALTFLALPDFTGRLAAQDSTLDALPGDTSLVFRLRNASDLARRFKASPFYALKDHPDVKKFLDDSKKKLDEGLQEARGKLGFDPVDLLGMVEGEVVFAVGGLDKIFAAMAAEMSGGDANIKPGDLPLVLVADAGASAPKLRENLGKLYEFAQKEGAKKDVEDFRGGKIITLSQKEEGGEKDGLEKVYFGDLGSRVLLSVSRPFLEQTMANLTAAAPDSLAKGADFMATQRETKADSDFSLFLNIRGIAASARKNFQSNAMFGMVWPIVEGKLLGRSLKNLGVTVSLRDNGIQSLAFINNGGASDGLLGILKGQTFAAKPSPLIPEDVDQFSSMSFNMQALYGLIKDIYGMAAPIFQMMGGGGGGGQGGMPDFEQFVEGNLQIKVKPLVDSIGNIFHFYQKGEVAAAASSPIPSFVIAVELKDEMPLKQVLDKFLAAGGQGQKYLDRDFYPLKMFGEGDGGPAIALADKHLVVGMNGDAVKELIRRAGKGGKGIGDTPGYQALSGMVPSQVNEINYASGKSFRDLLKTLKEAMAKANAGGGPDISILGEVVQGSIGWAQWKDQGFYSETLYSLKKSAGGSTTTKEAEAEKK